ncbi:MAG TPA: sulfotransferase [Thermoanaerobaculia bacterium]|jgi:hypothetical protein
MSQPIFILSCARSGSTLLRYILDTHPAIYAPPELNLGALASALAVAQAGLHGQRPSIPPLGPLSPEVRASVSDSISRMIAEQAQRRGKSVWCEKAPPNIRHIDLLTSLYPEASYICLYRNHLDTIDSCIETSRYFFLPPIIEHLTRHPESLFRAATEYWLDVTAKLIALERAGNFRTYRLRYEDLVKNPEKVLAGLFSFLNLEWQPGLIEAVYTTPHDVGKGDILVRYNDRINPGSVGRGRALPTTLLPGDQRARAEELNRELGYLELIEEILKMPIPEQPPAAVAHEKDESPSHAERGPRWIFEEHLPSRIRWKQR